MPIRTVWTKLLDEILPPSDTVRLVRELPTDSLLTRTTPGIYQGVSYLLPYDDPWVRAAVHANKYEHYTHAAKLLAHPLSHWLQDQPQPLYVVPMPLSYARYRTRKHNQVETILRHCTPRPVIRRRWLRRTRDTAPQTSLARSDRMTNVEAAFRSCNIRLSGASDTPLTIILIDDVVTTGATMTAARVALTPHLPPQATLQCLALAH
ncbi:MAG: ComF family protein [Patescibacteria group bacterium]